VSIDGSTLKGRIDFAIIAIREDEFEAVLDQFKPDANHLAQCRNRRYVVGSGKSKSGRDYLYAAARCIHVGQGEAQALARDMIDDLDPRLLVLVGIGGAVPSTDFTLGDVVCATSVRDFSIRAAYENGSEQYDVGGGPMRHDIQDMLAQLPVLTRGELQGWNSFESIGVAKPPVEVPPEGSDRYYGKQEWQHDVRKRLAYHFPAGQEPRLPLVTSRPVATSDVLMKDTSLLKRWLKMARNVAAVEMELGGVYLAARRLDREYPILAIRGISDIVGFKRDEAWTKYACKSAAAFAHALLQTEALRELGRPYQGEQAAPHENP
jgi:nucleoside phosphorylase